MLLALEVEVDVALPGEADAAVELDRAVGAEGGRVATRAALAMRARRSASSGSWSIAQAAA